MIRSLLRTGVLAAMLAGALAFAGSALANPTTPQLNPIPPNVWPGQLAVGWSPSTFDAGSFPRFYTLQVVDITAATSTTKAVFGTSTTIPVFSGHTYGLRLRAADVSGGQLLYSGSSVDVFHVWPLLQIPRYYEVWYPFPGECWVCGIRDIFVGDDPVVREAREIVSSARVVDREQIAGLYVDARGVVSAVQR